MRFSKRLLDHLVQAGWHEGRRAGQFLEEFQDSLGSALHPVARQILEEFADLAVGRRVFFCSDYAALALRERHLLPSNLRGSLCPIALTSYWSDTSVWVDECGRIFLLEPDEFWYFADSMDSALEIMVLGGEPGPFPPDLAPGRWEIGDTGTP